LKWAGRKKLKRKMVGSFVMALLIATIIPTVESMTQTKDQDLEIDLSSQRISYLSTVPDDIYFDQQYSLHNIGQTGGIIDCDIDAPEAWNIETGSSTIVIAVIDTGIDYTHPDLADKIWINEDEIPGNGIDDDDNGFIDDARGYNFYDDDNDPFDLNGHGTVCAGIAAADTNNGVGIAGVCWDCQIMPIKVAGLHNTEDRPDFWIKAIEYAVDNGADIISMSFGIEYYHEQLELAVNYAYSNGIFLTASAGNQGWSNEHYPAAYENVVGVAATNDKDGRMENAGQWSASSNYGSWVSVAAPGENIFSTMPSYHVTLNNYGFPLNYSGDLCGTSCAAPHVAGLAALILSKKPFLSPEEVETLILENVDPYNSSFDLGTGRINAYKAIIGSNGPPDVFNIDGPTSGKPEEEYTYCIPAVTDPDGDDIHVYWEWGDGTNSGWLGPFESGQEVCENHSWDTKGTYTIQAKLKDELGAESGWATLEVSIPRTSLINTDLFSFLYERIQMIRQILTSIG
jgi:subtilisin family serine protease